MQNKLVFNMGLKPVLKIEPPAARARLEISIYKNLLNNAHSVNKVVENAESLYYN